MNRSPSKMNTAATQPSKTPTTGAQANRKESKLTSKYSTKSLNKQSSGAPAPTGHQQKTATATATQKTSGVISGAASGPASASNGPAKPQHQTPPATPAATALAGESSGANVSVTTSTTSTLATTPTKKGTNNAAKSRIPLKTTNFSARYKEPGKESAKEASPRDSLTTRSLSRNAQRTSPKSNVDEQNQKPVSPSKDTSKETSERKATHKARTLRSGIPTRSPSTASHAPLKSTSPSPKRSNSKSDKEPSEKDEAVTNQSQSAIIPKVLSNAGDQDSSIKENNKSSYPKAKSFDNLEKRLNAVQSEFWKTLNTMQQRTPDQIKGNYKFVTIVRNDHSELMINNDDQTKAPATLPAYSVNDFKEKLKNALEICVLELVDKCKNPSNLDKSTIEKLRATVLTQMFDMVNELCTSDNSTDEIAKIKKELQDAQKVAKQIEKKLNEAQKAHEEKVRELEKAKNEIEAQTKAQIIELKKTIRQLESQKNTEHTDKKVVEDDLKTAKVSMSALTKKLKEYETIMKKDKEDLKQRDVLIENLSKELSDHVAKLNELKNKQKMNTTQIQQLQEYQKEVKELKGQVALLADEKAALEEEIQSMEKMENSDSVQINEMLSKLSDAETRITELQKALDTSMREKQIPQLPFKDNQLEISKLRQSESEKRREIEKLKIELSKAQYNIGQLEEQIQRDQKLLDVRSKLINSLQTNDKDQRLHVEELYAKVGEKNTAINELNNELRAKTEEFRNLFSTVSAKQMELSNQEHMIKLLEESNERSQMLRVKQEEKIARMEEEMAHLKQTIETYKHKLDEELSPRKGALHTTTSSDEVSDEICYYYCTNRKPKRRVNIVVKKYEV